MSPILPGELLAPTTPPAATRWLISGGASRGRAGPGDERLMMLDLLERHSYMQILIEEERILGC